MHRPTHAADRALELSPGGKRQGGGHRDDRPSGNDEQRREQAEHEMLGHVRREELARHRVERRDERDEHEHEAGREPRGVGTNRCGPSRLPAADRARAPAVDRGGQPEHEQHRGIPGPCHRHGPMKRFGTPSRTIRVRAMMLTSSAVSPSTRLRSFAAATGEFHRCTTTAATIAEMAPKAVTTVSALSTHTRSFSHAAGTIAALMSRWAVHHNMPPVSAY